MNAKIPRAVEQVRDAKLNASRGLSGGDYKKFLEELMAEVEGWKMELEEMD